MKSSFFSWCLGVLLLATHQTGAQEIAIKERGAHHRVIAYPTQIENAEGQTITVTNHITELANGLHYWDEGQWKETEEVIELVGNGAAARKGPHKVTFAPNLNTAGAVDLETPDGQHFRSQVFGLAYLDTTTGESVLIAELKDSIGELVSSNQIIYPDAFTDFQADVRFTYTKAGFEQDIILRQNPPSPSEYGLDPATSHLMVLTEFFDPPQPVSRTSDEGVTNIVQQRISDTLVDERLDFGSMIIGRGRAFSLEDEPEAGLPAQRGKGRPVGKQWDVLEGRHFLIESVELAPLVVELQELPAAPAVEAARKVETGYKLVDLVRPRKEVVSIESASIKKLAQAEYRPGLVVDYVILTSYTNHTFEADKTYYVSGNVVLSGITTIEGGTVVKFTNTLAGISIGGSLVSHTGPYRPAIFTAKDDNSVGETLPGSTGSPSGYYGSGLSFNNSVDYRLSDFRISHANVGIWYDNYYGSELTIENAQFVKCDSAIICEGQTIKADNVLFHKINKVFEVSDGTFFGQHLTVNQCDWLGYPGDGGGSAMYVTNSLLVAITNWSGDLDFYTNATAEISGSASTNVFQAVGAGGHYLLSGSPYRNAGTTAITTSLKKDLARKTTTAPILLTSNITIPTLLEPVAERDTGTPDLGYHYDPLDYVSGGITISSSLILTNGVALGVYGTSTGYNIMDGGELVSEGSAENLNWFARYNTVQEQYTNTWANTSVGYSVAVGTATSPQPKITARYTGWSIPAASGHHFYGFFQITNTMTFRDCQFFGADFFARSFPVSLYNNLFERVDVTLNTGGTSAAFNQYNNLHYSGSMTLGVSSTSVNKDNQYFLTTISPTTGPTHANNAYYTGSNQLTPTNASDVVLTNWGFLKGPLGRYYHRFTTLAGKGSRSSTAAGLYHHTIRIEQIREGTTTVDIGFHYPTVALTNLALAKMASQSSDYSGSHTATNGVNGSRTGSFAHTQTDTNAWWQVDFGATYDIDSVWIWNRTDTYSNRLSNFYIFVSDNAFTSTNLNTTKAQSGVSRYFQGVAANHPGYYEIERTGRYLRLQQTTVAPINIHEFEAYGASATTDTDGDGLSDYLEDLDGDGTLDTGENNFFSPEVSVPSEVTYFENDVLRLYNPTNAPGFVWDAGNIFNTATMTVSIVTNLQSGTDRLSLVSVGPSDVEVVSTTVKVGGVTVGSVSGNNSSGPLVVTFNSSATTERVSAVLRAVAFEIQSDTPSTLTRTARVLLTDGNGAPGAAKHTLIYVEPINDAPVLTFATNEIVYLRLDSFKMLDDAATVTDIDSPNFAGAFISAAFSTNGLSEDRLFILHEGTGAGQVGISGTNVTYGGTTVAWWTGGTNGIPLRIGMTSNTSLATTAAVQALIQSVAYGNNSSEPIDSTRTVRVVVTDGDGGKDDTSRSINVCLDSLDVVLILDTSGSMGSPTNNPPINHAKTAAKLFLTSVQPTLDQVSLVNFSDAATNQQRLTHDTHAVALAIDNMVPYGGTQIQTGLLEAQKELTNNLRNLNALPLIILMTDGKQVDTNVVIDAANLAKAQGTKIISIGLGTNVQTELLQTIASGPGYSYFTTNASELSSIYAEVAESLCRTINSPPIVDAGTNFTVSSVTLPLNAILRGWVTDDAFGSGSVTSYWSKVSGLGTVTFLQPNATNCNVSVSDYGTYVFRLTATDGVTTAHDEVVVGVVFNGGNNEPYVDAGYPVSTITNIPVTIAGLATDDGLPSGTLTTTWRKLSGPGTATFANANAAVTTVWFNQVGEYVLELEGDDGSLETTSTVTVIACQSESKPVDLMIVVDQSDSMVGEPLVQARAGAIRLIEGIDLRTHSVGIVEFAGAARLLHPLSHDRESLIESANRVGQFNASGTDISLALLCARAELFSERRRPEAEAIIVILSDGDSEGDPETIATSVKLEGVRVITIDVGGTLAMAKMASAEEQAFLIDQPKDLQRIFALISESLCLGKNKRPLVIAGYDAVVNVGQTATLTGTVFDDGKPGSSLSYEWTQESGSPAITFGSPNALTTTVSGFSTYGTHVFRLTAGDTDAEGFDELTLQVNAVPTVNAGLDQSVVFVPGVGVQPGASASDLDGFPSGGLTYEWRKISGPGEISYTYGSNSLTTDFIFPKPGIYIMQLLASDSRAIGSDTMTVEVRAPLEVGAGNDLVNTSFSSSWAPTLGGYIKNNSGGSFNKGWEQVSGPSSVIFTTATLTNTVVTINTAGTYVLRLGATNSLPFSARDEVVLQAGTGGNVAPTVNAGVDQSISEGLSAILNATVSSDATTVAWSQIDGSGIATFANPSSTNTIVTFSEKGTYILRLSASDAQLTGMDDVIIYLNQAPIIKAGANFKVLRNTYTNLLGVVTDDGFPVGQTVTSLWSVVSGPGSVVFGNSTSPYTTVSFDTQGYYTLKLLASDSHLQAEAMVIVQVISPPKAVKDVFSVVEDSVDNVLDVLANDTDLEGDPLSIVWADSLAKIADQQTRLLYTPGYNVNGTFDVAYSVSDGQGGYADSTAYISIVPVNDPPLARVDYFARENQYPDGHVIDVIANDEDADGLFTIEITGYTQPDHGTLLAQSYSDGGKERSRLVYVPASSGFTGLDSFTYTITDSAGITSTATAYLFIYDLTQLNQPPEVFAGYDQTVNQLDGADLYGDWDDDSTSHLGVNVLWSMDSGAGTVTFDDATSGTTHATFSAAGTYVLRLTAEDELEASGYDTVTITVNPATDRPPVAEFHNLITPESMDKPISVVTNSFFELVGSAMDPNPGETIEFSIKLYSPGDGVNPPEMIADLTPANNTTQVTSGVIATLDLNRFRNGMYDLVMEVTSSGITSYTEARFALDCELKLGQMTFSEEDYVVPVGGIPLIVVRRYDSLNETAGEFGYGWTYSIKDLEPQFYEDRAETYDEDPFADNGTFSLRTGGWRDLTLTMPDGRRANFTFRMRRGSSAYYAEWQAPPGVNARLEPMSSPKLIVLPCWTQSECIPPYWEAGDFRTPQEYFDFKGFNLIMPDKTRYEIYREDLGEHILPDGSWIHSYGEPVLKRIVQPSGDVISIEPDRIEHVNPQNEVTRALKFDYVNGVITAIRDPQAGVSGYPVVKYEYNWSNTNLIRVLRLVDRVTGTYVTNSYGYTNATYPHYLTSITNASGTPALRNQYDTSGKLVATYDALGNPTRFTNDTTSISGVDYRRQMIIDALGNTNQHMFDGNGNVILSIDPLGRQTRREYDLQNRVVSDTTPHYPIGDTFSITRYAYDDMGNRTAITNADNKVTLFSYNSSGQVIATEDPLTNITQFIYDNYGNLLTNIDAAGKLTSYTYDIRGNLTSSRDPLGLVVTNQYDNLGNLTNTTTRSAAGVTLSTVNYQYDLNGNRTNQMVLRSLPTGGSEWLITHWVYDAQNRVIRTIDPDGGTNRVVYNPNGQQQYVIDKLNRTNSYFYDARGLLTNLTYPDGLFERYAYDALGRRTNSVDRGGRTNKYVFNEAGQLYQTIYPDNTTNTTDFNSRGLVVATWDGRNNQSSGSTYDDLGRLYSTWNAAGNYHYYAYDAAGNQIKTWNNSGQETFHYYDKLNRRYQTLRPDNIIGETVFFDDAGRRIAVRDADNVTTWYGYNDLGQLTSVTNALLAVTRFGYDEVGNQTNQVDALNRQTKYEYDSMGRRTKRTLPGGQSETYGYNYAGNLIAHTNFNGHILRYEYDVLGRMTNKYAVVSGVSNNLARYVYSATGRLTTRVDTSGTYTWVYDERDRVKTNTQPAGTLYYTYDAAGNLTSMRSATSNGLNVTNTYDAANRLEVVAHPVDGNYVTYGYDGIGNLWYASFGNGLAQTWQYDENNRLTNLVADVSGTVKASYYYQLNRTGHRTNLSEVLNGNSRTYQWRYDALGRLNYENISSSGNLTYAYDSVGNRTNRTGSIGSLGNASYAYTSNDGITTDTYDNAGNTTVTGGVTSQYDYFNRLTNYNGTVTLVYDDDGNRVKRIQSGTTTQFLIDTLNPTGYAQVVEEKDGAGVLVAVYVYGLDWISQKRGSTTHYAGHDGHGSVRFLSITGGTTTDTYVYDAYGTTIVSAGSTTNPYRYCGEYFDGTLGLYYNRARYYEPGRGRFRTQDSYEGSSQDPLSLHKYLYGHANPVNNIDPSGHFSLTETMASAQVRVLMATSVATVGGATYEKYVRRNGGRNDQEQLPNLNSGRVVVNRHSIRIRNSRKSADELFDSLTHLNLGTSAAVPTGGVPVSGVGQTIGWDMPLLYEPGEADFFVKVNKFSRSDRFFSVVTLGGHPLRGWRFWRVVEVGGDIVVETGAVDEPNGVVGLAKMNYLGGNAGIMATWASLMENIVDYSQGDRVTGDTNYDFPSGHWAPDRKQEFLKLVQ